MIGRRDLLLTACLPLGAVLGCGSVSVDPGSVHTVVLDNESKDEIHDAQIIYGTVSIPRRPRMLGSKGGYEHDARMVVPETARVVWRTADSRAHVIDVALRRHVPHPSHFAGRLVFEFDDDGLRVILMERAPQGLWDAKRIF